MATTFCLSAQGTLYVWTGAHFESSGKDKKGNTIFDGGPVKMRDIHDNECCIPEDAERWRKLNDEFRKKCKTELKALRADNASLNLDIRMEQHLWIEACHQLIPGAKTFPSRNLKTQLRNRKAG